MFVCAYALIEHHSLIGRFSPMGTSPVAMARSAYGPARLNLASPVCFGPSLYHSLSRARLSLILRSELISNLKSGPV